MTLILRLIRQHRWDRPQGGGWLGDDDVPADPMADFANTTENRLSVWMVDDQKTNLNQIVVAMATNRDKLDKLDYVLFPRAYLDAAEIAWEDDHGDTPDDEANTWHRNLVELSADKVVALTKMVWKRDKEQERIAKADVRARIVDAVLEDRIPLGKLSRKLLAAIEPFLPGDAAPPRQPPSNPR